MYYKFKYGLLDNNIDITDIVYNKCLKNNQIYITGNDNERNKLFSDPLPYIYKYIYVYDELNSIQAYFINEEIIINLNSNIMDNKPLQFLHLVLYSVSDSYNLMYKTTSKYYDTFSNVKTIYYLFSNKIETDYLLIDNILYIKGDDTFLPGILEKTIKAFEYFNLEYTNFDYIIRSNISTIVNFHLLNKELKLNQYDYAGHKLNLQWLDYPCGIIDKTYFNTNYIWGICIVFSKKAFQKILENKSYLKMNIIDDVSIGILFKEYIPEYIIKHIPNSVFNNSTDITQNKIIKIINKTILYRNKTLDRNFDCQTMNMIIDILSKSKYFNIIK